MASLERPPNQLLQAISAEDFEALQPQLKGFKMVRDAVLAEAGTPLGQIYFPHEGAVSIVVRLSEGQTVAAAIIGRDSVVGAFGGNGDASTDAIVLFPGTASVLDIDDFRIAVQRSAPLRSLLARHQQALLARMIGVQRNAISIVAHALRQAGIIGYSRGQITITNIQALRQTSCECYEVVKAKHERLIGTHHR